jgi:hypothetical protein
MHDARSCAERTATRQSVGSMSSTNLAEIGDVEPPRSASHAVAVRRSEQQRRGRFAELLRAQRIEGALRGADRGRRKQRRAHDMARRRTGSLANCFAGQVADFLDAGVMDIASPRVPG